MRSPKALLLLAWWLGLYQPPDRLALRAIWKALVRDEPGYRVLFVGVRPYTRGLTRSARRAMVVTIDPDPRVRVFGARAHHSVRLQDVASVRAERFDVVIVNGVLGWGIDTAAEANRALDAAHDALAPDGTLVLGVNEARPKTPRLDAIAALRRFDPVAPAPFGVHRHEIPSPFEGTHTFLFFRRR